MKMYLNKFINIVFITILVFTSLNTSAFANAFELQTLPKLGTIVTVSPAFLPATLKGIVINSDDPLKFDFIINPGEVILSDGNKSEEYTKLIKYFLAALTVPENDQWVNLSPYEKDRIINENFGSTEMGRDLLAQDYLLKQITSSLMYPESGLGKTFWDRVYAKAYEQFGHINIPLNAFNKVWIVPESALVYESDNAAYIVQSHLKVLLEADYLALQKSTMGNQIHNVSGEMGSANNESMNVIIRQIILPELEREINEGKNFAQLRQVFSGMILATWFKQSLKESVLAKVYANQSKVKGVEQNDPSINEQIYQQYLQAFKKGAYNYIKEETNQQNKQTIPRKYFAGGVTAKFDDFKVQKIGDRAMVLEIKDADEAVSIQLSQVKTDPNKTLFIGDSTGLALTTALSDYNSKRLHNYAKQKQAVLFVIETISGGDLVLRKINPGRVKAKVKIPLALRTNPLTPKQKYQVNEYIKSKQVVVIRESEKGLILSAESEVDAAMSVAYGKLEVLDYQKPTFLFWENSSVPLSLKLIDFETKKLLKFFSNKIPLRVVSLNEDTLILEINNQEAIKSKDKLTFILSQNGSESEDFEERKKEILALIGSSDNVYVSKTSRGYILSREIVAIMPRDASTIFKQAVVIKYPMSLEKDWVEINEDILKQYLKEYSSQLNNIIYRAFDPDLEVLRKFVFGEISLGESVSQLGQELGEIETKQLNYIKSFLVSVWISIQNEFNKEQLRAIQEYLASDQEKDDFRKAMRQFQINTRTGFEALKEAIEIMDKDMAMLQGSIINDQNAIYYTSEHWLNVIKNILESSDQFERLTRVAATISKAKKAMVDDSTLIEMNRIYWLAQAEHWILIGNSDMARAKINLLAQAGPSPQLSKAIDNFDLAFLQDNKSDNLTPTLLISQKTKQTKEFKPVLRKVDPIRNAYLTFNLPEGDPRILDRIAQSFLEYEAHRDEEGMDEYLKRIKKASRIIRKHLTDKASLANTGGIDMNSTNMDIRIKRDVAESLLVGDVDKTILANFDGFELHIISIQPALSRPVFQTPVAK